MFIKENVFENVSHFTGNDQQYSQSLIVKPGITNLSPGQDTELVFRQRKIKDNQNTKSELAPKLGYCYFNKILLFYKPICTQHWCQTSGSSDNHQRQWALLVVLIWEQYLQMAAWELYKILWNGKKSSDCYEKKLTNWF